MSIGRQSTIDDGGAIKRLREKIEALKTAEATVSSASAKFEIKKELEELQLMLSESMQAGLLGYELGLDAVDADLLSSYFDECAKFDPIFKPHLTGEAEPRSQFLVSRGLASISPKGAIALTDEGILFCALRELINSTRFHVHVQLQRGEGKSATQENLWGSVLFLHRELSKALYPLSSRVMGSPEQRSSFGSEIVISEYPRIAIIEALTNFLIHRDYHEDDFGRVNIFSDRVEFVNPGLSAVDTQVLLSSTIDLEPKYSRNPRLIEAMSLSRLNQRRGSGVLRIRRALEENGTFLADRSIGLKLWNDEEKCRFHLVIYGRELTQLISKRQEANPADSLVDFCADISRIVKYAPAQLIGREAETRLLSDAWDKAVRGEKPRPHVLTFVAIGGEGKTSLVTDWAVKLANQEWPGCEAVFAWSFYSQGTREQTAVSSDLFLRAALTFFGDPATADSAQGAFDKGQRLAQLVGARRALLILDGVEPLQYAPTSPTPGELKDQGLAALLKGLASVNHGLCVVTTRYSIPDLRAYWQTTAPETKLLGLSKEAGVALLRSLGVRKESGSKVEFEMLVEDVKGHALTLNLLGTYLRDAHGGDIRRRDLVKLEEADAEEQGGHAFRVMDAYAESFTSGGGKGQRALALLSLLGLFDRPAAADCLAALLKKPAIRGLTGLLVVMSEAQRNIAFTRLESAKLLTVNRDAAGTLVSLDAHPLLREYFARRVSEQQPEAWRAAHRRLYEHLCATTKEGDQPTLEDLQPLYQAVAHGCQAGMQQEACDKVYFARIRRGNESYSAKKLGAFGSDLGAIACFFETPWSRVSPLLTEPAQAWLLNEAAFSLRALGRLTEALEPMRAGMDARVKLGQFDQAAISAGNLSGLELTLGDVAGAVGNAERSVTYADRSGDAFQRTSNRATHAYALHQAGRRAEAEARFREAEEMQAESQPAYPMLYSLRGFRYCDLLLAAPERSAWQRSAGFQPADPPGVSPGGPGAETPPDPAAGTAALLQSCRAVSGRVEKMFEWRLQSDTLLDIALEHLSLGRAALYSAILEKSELRKASRSSVETTECKSAVDQAVAYLRRAGSQDHVPRGLLTRAWLRSLTDVRSGPESAQSDLDEAWEIAERGPMPLFMAEIHLHRARLFGRKSELETQQYPWKSPQHDLAEARRLIEKHGYWRRKEELEDAEKAILS